MNELGMAASRFMSGAVTGNANLMEKIKRLARDNSFQPETPPHLGLGLFGRYIDASPGRDLLGQKLTKLPQLHNASIRIILEIVLRDFSGRNPRDRARATGALPPSLLLIFIG